MDSPDRINVDRADAYSPAIVDDLLHGVNEWRNIQDIVRLTFKALSDVVRAQGSSIREMERQLQLNVSRQEFNSVMSTKANVSDLTEVQTLVESRNTYIEIQSQLDEKVSLSEVHRLISSRPSTDEVKNMLDAKLDFREVETDILTLNNRIDDMQRELIRRIENCSSISEMDTITRQLAEKPNVTEMEEALQTKANKQSVANALHRKVNRSDMETALSTKADISEVQLLTNAMDMKAEQTWIEQLTEQLEEKLSRQELNHKVLPEIANKLDKHDMDMFQDYVMEVKNGLENKINETLLEGQHGIATLKAENEQQRNTMISNVAKKADSNEIDKMIQIISKKADTVHVKELMTIQKADISETIQGHKTEQKAEKRQLEDIIFERIKSIESNAQKVETEVQRGRDTFKNLAEDRKGDIEETARYIKQLVGTTKTDIAAEISDVKNEFEKQAQVVDTLVTTKVDKAELADTRQKISGLLGQKADVSEVQHAINSSQRDVSTSLGNLREDQDQNMKKMEDLLCRRLENKVEKSEFTAMMNGKADVRALQTKVTVEEHSNLRNEVWQISEEVKIKADAAAVGQSTDTISHNLESLTSELVHKANVKDICNLLDQKANVEDINKVLVELHKEIDAKAAIGSYQEQAQEQALINEALCAENCVARWIWKSGQVRTGYTVPWEIQSVNTCLDNFVWEKDTTTIISVAPGLYEINFGFFVRKIPSIKILVNDEVVTTAVNSSSYVIHHSSGRLKTHAGHPSGNITGLTMVDFLSLPPRARISIQYDGEPNAEGFLGLKKL